MNTIQLFRAARTSFEPGVESDIQRVSPPSVHRIACNGPPDSVDLYSRIRRKKPSIDGLYGRGRSNRFARGGDDRNDLPTRSSVHGLKRRYRISERPYKNGSALERRQNIVYSSTIFRSRIHSPIIIGREMIYCLVSSLPKPGVEVVPSLGNAFISVLSPRDVDNDWTIVFRIGRTGL